MTSAAIDSVPWRLQIPVYAAGMFSHSLNGMATVVLPLWVLSMETSPLLIGIALGSRYALLTLFSIHSGALMDRMGTRRVMLIFGVAGVVLHLAYPAFPSITAFILLQMMAGLAGSMGWIGSQALVGQIMKGNPTYTGRLSFSLRIGAFAGPPMVGAMWDYLGPWGAFATLAFWGFCAVIAAACLPAPDNGAHQDFRARDLAPRWNDYMDAFRLLAIPAILLVMAVTVMRHTAVSVQHTFYIVWIEQTGISGTLIGVLLSAWAVLGSISALTVGRLSRLVADYWLVIVAVTAQIVLISITPLLSNYTQLLIAMALYGGAMGISQPLMIALMSRSSGDAHQGKSAGLRTTANQLSAAVMPVLVGGIVELVGLEWSFYVVGSILVAGMGWAAYAVIQSPAFGSANVRPDRP